MKRINGNERVAKALRSCRENLNVLSMQKTISSISLSDLADQFKLRFEGESN
jgi:hypothetical protein